MKQCTQHILAMQGLCYKWYKCDAVCLIRRENRRGQIKLRQNYKSDLTSTSDLYRKFNPFEGLKYREKNLTFMQFTDNYNLPQIDPAGYKSGFSVFMLILNHTQVVSNLFLPQIQIQIKNQ